MGMSLHHGCWLDLQLADAAHTETDASGLRWADEIEAEEAIEFLVFRAGRAHLAVDLSFVDGYCNCELDEALPVVDLRSRQSPEPRAQPAGYLKLDLPGGRLALAIDDVPFLLGCRLSEIEYAAANEQSTPSSMASARIVTNDTVVHILDADLLYDWLRSRPAA